MTPEDLATIHGRCFRTPAPWSPASFTTLLADPQVILLGDPQAQGFVLVRCVAGEAEVMTLAVDPDHRRRGVARTLIRQAGERAAARGAETLFLEVAETNHPARALYAASGFTEAGRRPGYYRGPDGHRIAALILRRSIG